MTKYSAMSHDKMFADLLLLSKVPRKKKTKKKNKKKKKTFSEKCLKQAMVNTATPVKQTSAFEHAHDVQIQIILGIPSGKHADIFLTLLNPTFI